MLGAILGGALGAVGSIFGGIMASAAAKKQKKYLEQQQKENRAWYNRRYNENVTQRADAQRVLTQLGENLKASNRAAAGVSAVMGGSSETAAATKEANAKAMADTAADIVAKGEANKDNIEAQYRQRDNALQDQIIGVEAQRAQAIGQAVSGVASAAGSIASSFGGGSGSNSATQNTIPNK